MAERFPKKSNDKSDILKNFTMSWLPDEAVTFVVNNIGAEPSLNGQVTLNEINGGSSARYSNLINFNGTNIVVNHPDAQNGRCTYELLKKLLDSSEISNGQKISLIRSYSGLDSAVSVGGSNISFSTPIYSREIDSRGNPTQKYKLSDVGILFSDQLYARAFTQAANSITKDIEDRLGKTVFQSVARKIEYNPNTKRITWDNDVAGRAQVRTDVYVDVNTKNGVPRVFYTEDIYQDALRKAKIPNDPERINSIMAQVTMNTTGASSADAVAENLKNGVDSVPTGNIGRVDENGNIIGAIPANPKLLDSKYSEKKYPNVYKVTDFSKKTFILAAVIGISSAVAMNKYPGFLALFFKGNADEMAHTLSHHIIHGLHVGESKILNSIKLANNELQDKQGNVFSNTGVQMIMTVAGFLPEAVWAAMLGGRLSTLLAPIGGIGLAIGILWTAAGLAYGYYKSYSAAQQAEEDYRNAVQTDGDELGFYGLAAYGMPDSGTVVSDYVVQLIPDQLTGVKINQTNLGVPTTTVGQVRTVVPDGNYHIPTGVTIGQDVSGQNTLTYTYNGNVSITPTVTRVQTGGTVLIAPTSPGGRLILTGKRQPVKTPADYIREAPKWTPPANFNRQDQLRSKYSIYGSPFSILGSIPSFTDQDALDINDAISNSYILSKENAFINEYENVTQNNVQAGYPTNACGPENTGTIVQNDPGSLAEASYELELLREKDNSVLSFWSNGGELVGDDVNTPDSNNTIGFGFNDGSGGGNGRVGDVDLYRVIKIYNESTGKIEILWEQTTGREKGKRYSPEELKRIRQRSVT